MTTTIKLVGACVALTAFACAPHGESSEPRGETDDRVVARTDLFRNPFNKDSAHHRPIGTGAVYGNRGRLSRVTSVALVNANGTKYMNRVRPDDPSVTVRGAGRDASVTLRVPRDADMAPANEGDNCVLFFPRDGDSGSDIADSFFGVIGRPSGFSARAHRTFSLRGTDVGGGTSGSGMKLPAGLLRAFEIEGGGPIQHALQVATTRKGDPNNHVLSKRFRWPATRTDGNADEAPYNHGDIAYGTRVAIPASEADRRNSLGLTALGKLLFDAHLYYGVLVLDGTGEAERTDGARWNYRTDQGLRDDLAREVRDELEKIFPLLRPIENTEENEPFAGGGRSLGGVNTAWDAD